MKNYQSIATINEPEFINLEPLDINPGLSKCEIKVLYLGNNRNGTSIDRDAAASMAKSLRGAPIVGYYKEDKEDFFDHGEQVIYDGDGIHFKNLTRPYGFVAPDARVWFQEFQDTEPNGKVILRTYLMTTGYLWTGQYEEAEQVMEDGGKPHSMALKKNSLAGFWSENENSNRRFFIINDAIFENLCILGDDVEPCFEGSSVGEPEVSKNFSLDTEFKQTLYQMMKELQYTLQGGKETVEEIKDTSVSATPEVVEQEVQNEYSAEQVGDESNEASVDYNVEESAGDTEIVTDGATDDIGTSDTSDVSVSADAEYAKKDEEKEEKAEDDKEDKKADGESEESDDKEDDEDVKKKFALMMEKFDALQASFDELTKQHANALEALAHYKKRVEDTEEEKKDALIAEFSMLSDEDKKDVIEHKAEYSLETIKSKLAVIGFDKGVNFSKEAPKVEEEGYTVDNIATSYSVKPAWLKDVDDRKLNEQ